jgi:hypothetical protein
MNPRQKAATVYAYIRRLARDGKTIAPDFSGSPAHEPAHFA